ncbi:hypothetical protein [Saccharopolyspora sp. 6V]|uniref:hypothetical protein n=1 Tax=Saccharopolyspora sp. 6V TaxID=2877239 RepID=UPI001CD7243F|nr:hypothetical protein [Saccharopolyspora sp. 6V]MCA1191666.1 hypothetical protein [Saccharopolyspora sp. 6V]
MAGQVNDAWGCGTCSASYDDEEDAELCESEHEGQPKAAAVCGAECTRIEDRGVIMSVHYRCSLPVHDHDDHDWRRIPERTPSDRS